MVLVILIAGLLLIKTLRPDEKQQFREIKQDMLTLQKRLNEKTSSKWEYTEECQRTGAAFGRGITTCTIILASNHEDINQERINAIVKETNDILSNGARDLFVPVSEPYDLVPPQLSKLTYFDSSPDGLDGSSIDLHSARKYNVIPCHYIYNLSVPKTKPVILGNLGGGIICSSETTKTYFDRSDLDSTNSDYKAESPL